MNWPRAILFDLDGTLIDSAPDLRTSVNMVLAQDNLGPLDVEVVRAMIGNGIRKLVERAYVACSRALESRDLDNREMTMNRIYAEHLTDETFVYPGVEEALAMARNRDIKCAVVTNKPTAATFAILNKFGLADSFGAVIGGDQDIPRKPAPEPLWAAISQLGVTRKDAVMVGDSIADVTAARAAGIAVIAVAGGYSKAAAIALGADKAITSLFDLGSAIDTWP
jgi:phosphoglycolate phosphatase